MNSRRTGFLDAAGSANGAPLAVVALVLITGSYIYIFSPFSLYFLSGLIPRAELVRSRPELSIGIADHAPEGKPDEKSGPGFIEQETGDKCRARGFVSLRARCRSLS